MRIVQLSDHPRELLQQARDRRATQAEQDRLQYEGALAEHRMRVGALRQDRDRARAERRWWSWLRGVFAMWRELRRGPARPAALEPVSGREESIKAGIRGEQQVVSELQCALGDEWVLIRGYRNRRGEIDHLLLGQRRLVAIEVKNHNATVDCDGDLWWSTKYDRFGNQVEHPKALTDKGGRSPSVQLNEPADQLQAFLRSRGLPIMVQRVVLFTHPRSRIGRCTNPTVHVATATTHVIDLINGFPPGMTADEQARIEALIQRDHRYCERHRQR